MKIKDEKVLIEYLEKRIKYNGNNCDDISERLCTWFNGGFCDFFYENVGYKKRCPQCLKIFGEGKKEDKEELAKQYIENIENGIIRRRKESGF